MYFYEILQSIMNEKKLKIPDVARMCGLPDSTIRSIINRKNKTVALEVAFKLSKGLNVSLEKLNGEDVENYNNTPNQKETITNDISTNMFLESDKKQREFFDIFDGLSPILQDYLIKTAKELLETQSKLDSSNDEDK